MNVLELRSPDALLVEPLLQMVPDGLYHRHGSGPSRVEGALRTPAEGTGESLSPEPHV